MAFTLLVPKVWDNPEAASMAVKKSLKTFRGFPITYDLTLGAMVIRIDGALSEVPEALANVPFERFVIFNGHAPYDGSPEARYPHPEDEVEGVVDCYDQPNGRLVRTIRVEGRKLENVETLYSRLRRGDELPEHENSRRGRAKLSDAQIEELRRLTATIAPLIIDNGTVTRMSHPQIMAIRKMTEILNVPIPATFD